MQLNIFTDMGTGGCNLDVCISEANATFQPSNGLFLRCSDQVTASRIQLCGLASATGGGTTGGGSGDGSQDAAAAAAEGDAPDSPRPGLGKRHASWATMEGIADTFASRLVPFRSVSASLIADFPIGMVCRLLLQ